MKILPVQKEENGNQGRGGRGPDSAYEKVGLTILGAGIALCGREVIERLRDRQKQQEELTALLDVYLREIVAGADKCAQFVRQVSMNQVSRSKLSILIGAGKIDRVAQLGAPPELHGALHDIYRLFDQVAHQISKGKGDDFGSIMAFVQGEFESFTTGYENLSKYARILHGDATIRFGRRLLGKAVWALTRTRREFMFGLPYRELALLSLDEIKALDTRFEWAKAECEAWFEAHHDAVEILNAGKMTASSVGVFEVSYDGTKLGHAKAKRPNVKGKTLRVLVGYLELYMRSIDASKPWALPIPLELILNLGDELAGVNRPKGRASGVDEIRLIRESWSPVWKSIDPQPYD